MTVSQIGQAILGSGLTTITGFLALTLSIMPMLQKLGASLALGIFYSLSAAIFVMPIVIILEEDAREWYIPKLHKIISKQKKELQKK